MCEVFSKKLILIFLCSFFKLTQASSSEILEAFSRGINPPQEICYNGYPIFSHIKIGGKVNLTLISSYLSSKPVILEAGGHEGEDTIQFVNLWPEAYIITFEPNPRAFRLLRKNCANYPQIHPYQLALDLFDGTSPFYLCQGPDKNSDEGASSLLPSSPFLEHYYQGEIIKVSTVQLDRWCKDNRVDQIDFMWLDLEGKELDVLKGAQRILQTTQIIFTETNLQEFRTNGCKFSQLREFLETNGFSFAAHWYIKDWQGDALFIREELLKKILNTN